MRYLRWIAHLAPWAVLWITIDIQPDLPDNWSVFISPAFWAVTMSMAFALAFAFWAVRNEEQ